MARERAQELEQDLAAIARISVVPTIVRTVREWTQLRYTVVARVLPDQWIACAVHDELGLGIGVGDELDIETTFCREVRESGQPLLIEHASRDPQYCGHFIPAMYGFESYIAVPIFRRTGEYFGNLCGLDPLPRVLADQRTLRMLELFSELISLQLAAGEQHERERMELERERAERALREESLAVLAHDLRNPLMAILANAKRLSRSSTSSDGLSLEIISDGAACINELADRLLDVARGRLGDGIALDLADVFDLEERLRQVAAEVGALEPQRPICLHFNLTGAIRCDPRRIEQLLSNLLANALQHGASGTPVEVHVRGCGSKLRIEVTNEGELSADVRGLLFQPYTRSRAGGKRRGLGLGLFIVAEIARAHGGRMEATTGAGRVSFAFTMGSTGESGA